MGARSAAGPRRAGPGDAHAGGQEYRPEKSARRLHLRGLVSGARFELEVAQRRDQPVLTAMETGKPMSRQAVAAVLQRMVRTRVGGFLLEYQANDTAGKRAGLYR